MLFFPFRIAIWNRKIFISSLVVGAWLAGIALNLYSRFRAPSCALHVLIYCACTYGGLTTVRPLFECFQSYWTHAYTIKSSNSRTMQF
jgi:hypothetical protein